MLAILQVIEAILDNARLVLQTENIQANAEDLKERYMGFRKKDSEKTWSYHHLNFLIKSEMSELKI